MVTDDLPWSVAIERWIPSLLAAGVPFLGICYGHQLLARAAGGEVGFHPRGKEIGTVVVNCLPVAANDRLFQQLPASFAAHVTHAQTVLRLPPGALRLAANEHEPNHAFSLGESAWGVQFHPEYTPDIMRAYVREQAGELAAAGMEAERLLQAVAPTPEAGALLGRFARLVDEHCA
jgi:GMP synthase (glutamine-hydrolysing)